ncbi:MAG: EAL domain-containing protein [Pseudomonadota bacterium]|jgi:diguanylate cyclase (GGDEF)-like protein|nr:EAL domain-containing protein [Pseudomonadota bacterium]
MTEEMRFVGTVRILVVDDNPAIHRDFEKILGPELEPVAGLETVEALLFGESTPQAHRHVLYTLDFAQQGKQGVEMVERALKSNNPFALAFIDMRMPPGWDGLETIERLWAIDPNVQVVICSAHSDYDWNDLIDRLGQTDRLLVLKKPFEPIEVLQCASAMSRKWQYERALRSQVETLEQVVATRTKKLEAANQQLRHLATHDSLTGLPNRILLDDRLAQAIAHANRDSTTFGVLVVDLDRFKFINDTLGHHAGDTVLDQISRRLVSVTRDIDTVARTGGDEFVVVVSPSASTEDVYAIAQRANEALRAPLSVNGVELHVTSSIGVAYYPTDATTADSLMGRADAAMYCAKQRGRNAVQRFAQGMDATTIARVGLESALHHALQANQFELYYQPKADAATGDVHSAEALIRWRHPELGLVPPNEFIPLAEECGLINEIGAWVLREACRQCAEWQRNGLPAVRVAVNVSAVQFHRGDLRHIVQDALAAANLEARFLEIELTESAVMTNPEESVAVLEQLSCMGVMVSVDDFGTGYSSINYLKRFPIDKLKIDQSFVQSLESDVDASIVQAIVSLAHSLRLKVVAEGVETPEQLKFLRSLGCDQYQGFHFSPPLPPQQFAALLRDWQREEDAESTHEAVRTHSKLFVAR